MVLSLCHAQPLLFMWEDFKVSFYEGIYGVDLIIDLVKNILCN